MSKDRSKTYLEKFFKQLTPINKPKPTIEEEIKVEQPIIVEEIPEIHNNNNDNVEPEPIKQEISDQESEDKLNFTEIEDNLSFNSEPMSDIEIEQEQELPPPPKQVTFERPPMRRYPSYHSTSEDESDESEIDHVSQSLLPRPIRRQENFKIPRMRSRTPPPSYEDEESSDTDVSIRYKPQKKKRIIEIEQPPIIERQRIRQEVNMNSESETESDCSTEVEIIEKKPKKKVIIEKETTMVKNLKTSLPPVVQQNQPPPQQSASNSSQNIVKDCPQTPNFSF